MMITLVDQMVLVLVERLNKQLDSTNLPSVFACKKIKYMRK